MKIANLTPSLRVRGRWLCVLEDGTILRITENEVAAFGLFSGGELSRERLEELTAAARAAAVREKALALLSARPMSRKELVDKLTARPRDREKEPLADREMAEAAADRLEELGYLNDADYALALAEHCAARGYGPAKLREELYRRGVPREHWDAALETMETPAAAIDAFLAKKLRGADPSDPKALKRAADALACRGFHWEDIKDALRRHGAEEDM